jgi:hypothetical protein
VTVATSDVLLETLADLVEQALNNWSGEVEEWDRRARATLKDADDALRRRRKRRADRGEWVKRGS